MAESALAVKAQTIKQAKAAFKARGGAGVSEQEQKRIDRQVQLSQRSWRLREQEKKRNEASRKRQEREGEENSRALLATQVRRDKFGYKSSQMHLGAFFGGVARKTSDVAIKKEDTIDEFEDDEVDDEMLLHALESPPAVMTESAFAQGQTAEPRAMTASLQRSMTEPTAHIEHDLDCFWDDLESSTQIARELTNDDTKTEPKAKEMELHEQPSFSWSFDSHDFDLTADDLDELVAAKLPPTKEKSSTDRQLMPPPALPMKPKPNAQSPSRMPPPNITTRPSSSIVKSQQPTLDLGFSMSQLESFVEDDLQLTQMAPD